MEQIKTFHHDVDSFKKTIISGNLCKFDIPDIIIESKEPLTAKQINERIGSRKSPYLDALFKDKPHTLIVENLERFLRAAASCLLVTEDKERRFGATQALEVLTTQHPCGLKFFIQTMVTDHASYLCWGYLGDSIGDPNISVPIKALGSELFPHYHRNQFEFINFHNTMKIFFDDVKDLLVANYDFNGFKTIVDIGGSTGHLVRHVLKAFPKLSKGINFDLKVVIDKLRSEPHDLGDRYELVDGDFFQNTIPVGDCYLLKFILHDWSDERCDIILKNIALKMQKDSKLLVMDIVLNDFGTPSPFFPMMLDLQMMLLLQAKERRRDQWEELMERSGFVIERVLPLGQLFIIECKKK